MLPGIDENKFREMLGAVFTPAQPIGNAAHLHGREQKLRLIDRALHSPGKHIFVYGDRGVGKTSLARTAAAIYAGDETGFAFVACDQKSTFFDIVRTIYRQLHQLYALGKFKVESAEFNIWLAKFKTSGALSPPELNSINDAVEIIRSIIPKTSGTPVVVIDEFDQLSENTDKKYIADLIKQLSDQKINLRLIICGIGSSLKELIGVHLSTDRYIATVPLEPISHDARWQIIEAGAKKFNIEIDRNSLIRIGQLSDGFPYYVHLMGEQIFWQIFDDAQPVIRMSIDHYKNGLRSATEEAQTSLRQSYELATQKHKLSQDYEEVLWAVADGALLDRATSDIFDKSYIKIMDQREGRPPLTKELFYQRLNSLKKKAHGYIVIGSRQGWYGFRENIIRGFVRLRAEQAGIEIGADHALEH